MVAAERGAAGCVSGRRIVASQRAFLRTKKIEFTHTSQRSRLIRPFAHSHRGARARSRAKGALVRALSRSPAPRQSLVQQQHQSRLNPTTSCGAFDPARARASLSRRAPAPRPLQRACARAAPQRLSAPPHAIFPKRPRLHVEKSTQDCVARSKITADFALFKRSVPRTPPARRPHPPRTGSPRKTRPFATRSASPTALHLPPSLCSSLTFFLESAKPKARDLRRRHVESAWQRLCATFAPLQVVANERERRREGTGRERSGREGTGEKAERGRRSVRRRG